MLLCNAEIIDIHGNKLPSDLTHRNMGSIIKAQLKVHPTRRAKATKPHFKLRAGYNTKEQPKTNPHGREKPLQVVDFKKEMKHINVVPKNRALAIVQQDYRKSSLDPYI